MPYAHTLVASLVTFSPVSFAPRNYLVSDFSASFLLRMWVVKKFVSNCVSFMYYFAYIASILLELLLLLLVELSPLIASRASYCNRPITIRVVMYRGSIIRADFAFI